MSERDELAALLAQGVGMEAAMRRVALAHRSAASCRRTLDRAIMEAALALGWQTGVSGWQAGFRGGAEVPAAAHEGAAAAAGVTGWQGYPRGDSRRAATLPRTLPHETTPGRGCHPGRADEKENLAMKPNNIAEVQENQVVIDSQVELRGDSPEARKLPSTQTESGAASELPHECHTEGGSALTGVTMYAAHRTAVGGPPWRRLSPAQRDAWRATATNVARVIVRELDCGQDGVCAIAPGCLRHWKERAAELVRERDAAAARVTELTEELEASAARHALEVERHRPWRSAESWETPHDFSCPTEHTRPDVRLTHEDCVLFDRKRPLALMGDTAGFLMGYVDGLIDSADGDACQEALDEGDEASATSYYLAAQLGRALRFLVGGGTCAPARLVWGSVR